MKAKITRGKSFRGLLNYLLDHDRGEVIGGNMSMSDKIGMSLEFGSIKALRPDISKPVWHCSLSLPPGDDLTISQWQDVAADFLRKMGIGDNQYCIVKHMDKEHKHVHLVVNRVNVDGGVWYAEQDVPKAIKVCRELEKRKDYLRDTSERDYSNHRYYPSYREQTRYRKRQDLRRQHVHDAIRRIIDTAPYRLTPKQFVKLLAFEGIEVLPNISTTGRVNGFSFKYDGVKYTGSKVKAKWRRLRTELDYRPERDNPYLLSLIGRGAELFDIKEYEKLKTAIGRYAQTLDYTAFQSTAHTIDAKRLLRGASVMQAEHYAELGKLYERSKTTWERLSRLRKPRHISFREAQGLMIILAVNPMLGLLLLLPIIFERIAYMREKADAKEISNQIVALKQEIETTKEQISEITKFREVSYMYNNNLQDMKLTELGRQIQLTLHKGADFSGYISFIQMNAIQSANPRADDLYRLYNAKDWKNAPQLRGTEQMITAALKDPASGIIYLLPILFERLARNGTESVDGTALERELMSWTREYFSREAAVPQTPITQQVYRSQIKNTTSVMANSHDIEASIDNTRYTVPRVKFERIVYPVGERIEIDDGRYAEIAAPETVTEEIITMAVQEYSNCGGRIDSLSTETQEFVDSVFLSIINENDVKKIQLIPAEYLDAAKHIFLQEIDASPNVHKMANERYGNLPHYDSGMEL